MNDEQSIKSEDDDLISVEEAIEDIGDTMKLCLDEAVKIVASKYSGLELEDDMKASLINTISQIIFNEVVERISDGEEEK